MEKLIEFLRNNQLLRKEGRTITIEMFEDELENNFFTKYLEELSKETFISADSAGSYIKNIRSIAFPQGFTLQLKIKK